MMSDRYDAGSSVEGLYQPGSEDTVLLNKLGITRLNEINDVELDLLIQLTDSVLDDVTDE